MFNKMLQISHNARDYPTKRICIQTGNKPCREKLFIKFKSLMQVFTCSFHQRQQLWKAKVSNFIHERIHVDFKGPAKNLINYIKMEAKMLRNFRYVYA